MAKSALPNIFTFSNLGCGILSILMTFEGSSHNTTAFKWACFFILLAALIDRYDGRIARFFNVSSDLGKELDSLADLVSFGVAPSILAYNLYEFSKFGAIGYVLVLLFPIAGAYRLARFNSCDFNGDFTGIPITIAGVLLAFYSLIILVVNSNPNIPITIVFIIMLSYLMICNLKFKKI